jgi:hypothetical protein
MLTYPADHVEVAGQIAKGVHVERSRVLIEGIRLGLAVCSESSSSKYETSRAVGYRRIASR